MNIYIKSFNRPFYLDRCLKSIFFNVINFDKIIVLDDGTLNNFKEKILEKYPRIIWRSSGVDDGKYDLVRKGNTKKAKELYGDPASFWLKETQKDEDDYFLLIEDDTWFVNMIDLHDLHSVLLRKNAVICKLWWGDYSPLEDATITEKYILWNNLSVNFIEPQILGIKDAYKIYIVAMAIFRKDYYASAIKKVNHFADETTQITEALNFYKNNPEVTFSKMSERVIYQGWATTVRHDDAIKIDIGINSFDFVDILNQAWFDGALKTESNYPYDYHMDTVIRLFEKYDLSPELISIYKDWRTKPQLNPTTLYYN